jgi:hypothetical protein
MLDTTNDEERQRRIKLRATVKRHRWYRMACPKNIEEPRGFPSLIDSSLVVLTTLDSYERSPGAWEGSFQLDVSVRMASMGTPTYYVDQIFLSALLETDPPEQFPLSQIKWPLDAMRLVFPIGAIPMPAGGGSLGTILWVRYPANETVACRPPCEWMTLKKDIDQGAWLALGDDPTRQNWMISGGMDLTSSKTLVELVDYEFAKVTYAAMIENADEGASANAGKIIGGILLRLLVFFNTNEDYIKGGEKKIHFLKRRPPGWKAKPDDVSWAPTWLGRGLVTERDQLAGIGRSPRAHWRRGHFRNQPMGSRAFPSYDLIWIKPVWVKPFLPSA